MRPESEVSFTKGYRVLNIGSIEIVCLIDRVVRRDFVIEQMDASAPLTTGVFLLYPIDVRRRHLDDWVFAVKQLHTSALHHLDDELRMLFYE
jgi:hypothetical protein